MLFVENIGKEIYFFSVRMCELFLMLESRGFEKLFNHVTECGEKLGIC